MRMRIFGHALHPMLVVFPLGLLATSLVWDIVYLATENPMWGAIAYWTIIAGLIGGVLAAIPGLVDWLAIPKGTRARRVGQSHLILNLMVVGLFVLSAGLRATDGYATPSFGEMIWGWIGLGLAGISGWLGGELIQRLGVTVWKDANLNAPSSLRMRRPPEPGAAATSHPPGRPGEPFPTA